MRRSARERLIAPMNAPTPIAELRMPTPLAPKPRSSTDATTMNTWTAPATACCAAMRPIITRRAGCLPIALKPASTSETIVGASISLLGRSTAAVLMSKRKPGRYDEEECGQKEHNAGARNREEEARERGSDEEGEAGDATRNGVRGGELGGGAARERRRQSGVSWSIRGYAIVAATART